MSIPIVDLNEEVEPEIVPATTYEIKMEEKGQDDEANEKQPKSRSHLWKELKMVTLPSGEPKAQCPSCAIMYKLSKILQLH